MLLTSVVRLQSGLRSEERLRASLSENRGVADEDQLLFGWDGGREKVLRLFMELVVQLSLSLAGDMAGAAGGEEERQQVKGDE